MSEHNKQTTNRIITTLDLPEDLFLGLPNISLLGNKKMYISNHRGILSYSPDEIIVIIKDYQILIRGKQLNIVNYSKDELSILGHVCSLEYV